LIGISQQELTHDKVHKPRGISVTSHVSWSLSFPSQRQRCLSLVKHGINLSGERKRKKTHYLSQDSVNGLNIFQY